MPESKHRKTRRRGGDKAAAETSPLRSASEFGVGDLGEEESLPTWYKSTMFGLMIVGLLWLITWYVTSGQLPIGAIGGWNIFVGFGVIMIGFFMTMKWK